MPLYLDRHKVSLIKTDLITTLTQEEIADKHGISQAQVSRIATGRAWRSVPNPDGSRPVQVSRRETLPPTIDEGITKALLGERAEVVIKHLESVGRSALMPIQSDEFQAQEDEELWNAMVIEEDESEN